MELERKYMIKHGKVHVLAKCQYQPMLIFNNNNNNDSNNSDKNVIQSSPFLVHVDLKLKGVGSLAE